MIHDKIKNINRYAFLWEIADFDIKNYQNGKFDMGRQDFLGLDWNMKPKMPNTAFGKGIKNTSIYI
jgi:hypothetical protein